MVTTKRSTSQFKKTMEKLKVGDSINTSHPAGTFTLDETTPAVFIAGGVGITPFRSMIKYSVDKKLSTPITLVYFNSDGQFIFKKEFSLWQKNYPKLSIIYHNTKKIGRLYLDSRFLILDSIFYLAGPPKMVDDFEKILLDSGVDQANIRYDRFDGY